MDKKELAIRLNVSLASIYNWLDERPDLMELIELGLLAEKYFEKSQEYVSTQKNFLKLPKKDLEIDPKELKINKTKLSQRIGIVPKTIRVWEKEKPEIIKLVRLGLLAEKHMQESERFLELFRVVQSS